MTESIYQENKTKVLSDREHVLLRPQMYLGGVEKMTERAFILNNTNKIANTDIEYVPVLTRMCFEIINNSIDEYIRTNGGFATEIKIHIKENKIVTIRDNGRGLPSNIEENTKLPSPVVCVTQLKAGGNFEHDDVSKTQGTNGVGSACVNILSSSFSLDTYDGNVHTLVSCDDNMDPEKITYAQGKLGGEPYTQVRFIPDFNRFGVESFGDSEFSIIKKMLIDQSICYPGIKFYFNGKLIKCKSFKDYAEYYSDNIEILESDHCNIAVYSGDETQSISFGNGLHTTDNGTHVEYVKVNIAIAIREKYKKKYAMSPQDIYSNLHFIVMMKDIISPRFTSQTKTKFSTPVSKMKYAFADVDFKKFTQKITSNKNMMDPILQIFKLKEEIKKKRELSAKEKEIGKAVLIPKLVEASVKNKSLNRIYLAEGDSALNKFARAKSMYMAGFPLRGKFISAWDRSASRMMENNEVFTLCKILGLKLSDPDISNGNYAEIVIMTDEDPDGSHIGGLLIEFIYKFWPDYIKNGKIFKCVSPLIVLEDDTMFYGLAAFKKHQADNNGTLPSPVAEYNKGLGSLSQERYETMLNTLRPITFGEAETCHNSLRMAFSGKHSHKRKEWLS